MAFVGKLRRGMKWDFARDSRGNLPLDITNDIHKMDELNFFLDFVKGKNKEKLFDILKKKNLQVYFRKRKLDGEKFLNDKKFLQAVVKKE